MIQQVDESIDSFLSRLRAQAAKCKFVYTVGEVIKDVSDELIRDRIVVGVQDETTRSRLLREPKLTLTSAVEMIRAVEVVDEYEQRIKARTLKQLIESQLLRINVNSNRSLNNIVRNLKLMIKVIKTPAIVVNVVNNMQRMIVQLTVKLVSSVKS